MGKEYKKDRHVYTDTCAALAASVARNPPANAGDAGSSPGLGQKQQKEMATHPSTLAWEVPWTEELGGP